jgi:hypothetical protein
MGTVPQAVNRMLFVQVIGCADAYYIRLFLFQHGAGMLIEVHLLGYYTTQGGVNITNGYQSGSGIMCNVQGMALANVPKTYDGKSDLFQIKKSC